MSDGLTSINDLKVVISASSEELSKGLGTAREVISKFAADGTGALGTFDSALAKTGTAIEAIKNRVAPWIGVIEAVLKVAGQVYEKVEKASESAGLSEDFGEFKKSIEGVKESAGGLGTALSNIGATALENAKTQAVGLAGGMLAANESASSGVPAWKEVEEAINKAIGATRRFIESYDKISNRSADTLRINIDDVSKSIGKLDEQIASRQGRSLIGPLEFFQEGTIEVLEAQRAALLKKRDELYMALLPKELPALTYAPVVPDEARISPEFSALLAKYDSEAKALEGKSDRLDKSAVAAARAAAEDKFRAEVMARNITLTEAEESAIRRYLNRVEQATSAQEDFNAAKKRESVVRSAEDQAATAEARLKSLSMTTAEALKLTEAERVRQALARDGLSLSDAERAKLNSAIERRAAATEAEREFNKAKQESERRDKGAESIIGGLEYEIAGLRNKAAAFGEISVEQRAAQIQADLLAKAQQRGVELTDEEIGRTRTLSRAKAELEDSAKQLRSSYEMMAATGQAVARGLENAFRNWMNGQRVEVKDFVRSVLADLALITLRKSVLDPIGSALSGIGGSFLSGALAEGGPANRGEPYLVGERGPEIFVPGDYGNVIPNHALGNGTSGGGRSGAPVINLSVHTHVDARGAYPESIADIKRAVAEQNAGIPARVLSVVHDAKERGGI